MSTLQLHPDDRFSIDSLLVTLSFYKPLVKNKSKFIESDTPITEDQLSARLNARLDASVRAIEHLNNSLTNVVETEPSCFKEDSQVLKNLREIFDAFYELEDELYSIISETTFETPADYLDIVSTYSSLIVQLEGLVFQSEGDDLDWDDLLSSTQDDLEEWKPELA